MFARWISRISELYSERSGCRARLVPFSLLLLFGQKEKSPFIFFLYLCGILSEKYNNDALELPIFELKVFFPMLVTSLNWLRIGKINSLAPTVSHFVCLHPSPSSSSYM